MTVHTIDDVVGNEFEIEVDERPRYSQGNAVFFTTDKKYAISFYPEASVKNVSVKRLQNIIYQLPKKIFAPPGGGFYRNIFAWPEFLVNDGKKLAFVTPFYPPNFFFRPDPGGGPHSPLAGSPKEPHWYASPVNAQTLVPKGERGTFLGLLNVCLNLCRGIGRLHEFRLLPGDLSFHSFLADPVSGGVLIRQIAHLITPEHPGYRIYESLEFLAPEQAALRENKSDKPIPHSEVTDRHALAVLIYQLLLRRHPLIGSKRHYRDDDRNTLAALGSRALFIENPKDRSNAVKAESLGAESLPWADPERLPCAALGPRLAALIGKAFVEGLFDPPARPSARDWADALAGARDLVSPCANPGCPMGWFVFDSETFRCPYCGALDEREQVPCLEFFPERGASAQAAKRLVVRDNQYLYQWHTSKKTLPREFLADGEKQPVGYFSFHNGQWCFVNQTLADFWAKDASGKQERVPVRQKIDLTPGLKLRFSSDPDSHLATVRFCSPPEG